MIFIAFFCVEGTSVSLCYGMLLPLSCFLAPSSFQLPGPSSSFQSRPLQSLGPAPVPHTDVNTGIYHGPCNLQPSQSGAVGGGVPVFDLTDSNRTLGELFSAVTCLSTGPVHSSRPITHHPYRIQGLQKGGAGHSWGGFGDSTRIPE